MNLKNKNDQVNLADRIGVGVLSAICFLLTFAICIALLLIPTYGYVILLTNYKVWVSLTVFFFFLGFFTLDNYFIKILTPAWKFIDEAFKR